MRRPMLYISQILAWADAHQRRYGQWPRKRGGRVTDAAGEKWCNVDMALRKGLRGLPGGSSLARLLAEQRGVRNHRDLPKLNVVQILAWADAHHQRTGQWPDRDSGPVARAPSETWSAIDTALSEGLRGLPGGSSLARLLAQQRGVRHPENLPELTVPRIIAWAEDHHRRTGKWPTQTAGPIAEVQGETWRRVDAALRQGHRDLPGGSSLARLLVEGRGVRNRLALPKLAVPQILAWADAHHDRTGQWPTHQSGPIPDAPGDTWLRIDNALREGFRGLPGGSSLSRLLDQQRRSRQPVQTGG